MSSAPSLGSVLYTQDQIADRVKSLGKEISEYYAESIPVVITLLKGATVFAADLTRQITVPHEMDFLAVAAHDDGSNAMQAQVLKDVQVPIAGRDVILVEDIIDTGITLKFVNRWLNTHEAASIEVCTLLDRPHRRLHDTPIRFRGFSIPDKFVVGYGFDYQQKYRNLRDIHELELDHAAREILLST